VWVVESEDRGGKWREVEEVDGERRREKIGVGTAEEEIHDSNMDDSVLPDLTVKHPIFGRVANIQLARESENKGKKSQLLLSPHSPADCQLLAACLP
jgi:hypothetical protein